MSLEAAFEVGRLFLPLKTIADQFAVAQKDLFIRLPALRGYWPMSVVDYIGGAVDHSGGSVNLQRTGDPDYGYDGNAYVQLGVATDFLYGATAMLNFTGTEAWVDSGIQGLTVGGWFWVDSSPGVDSGFVSKFGGAAQYGFVLNWLATNAPRFMVSGNGTTTTSVTYSPRSLDTWHFVVGRFTPGAELAIFVNGDKVTNTSSIPASINVSTQNFEVGRYFNDNARVIEGRARDVFICAVALPDATLTQLHRASMPA